MKNRLPHVFLIVTDQQRYETIGALGYRYMITPTLDRIAAEGAVFANCFATAPSCVPSRASFFNGLFPHTSGVLSNNHFWDRSWIEQFRHSGYHCVNIGKMHTKPYDAPCGFDQRFIVENKTRPLTLDAPHGDFYDEYNKHLANNCVPRLTREWYSREQPQYETALGCFPWPYEEKYHPDVFVGNMTCWFLEQRQADSPLLLQIGFPGPHPPYDAPQRYIDRYGSSDFPIATATEQELMRQPAAHQLFRNIMKTGTVDAIKWSTAPTRQQLCTLWQHYAANITLIDDQIERILQTLDRNGYLENYLMVFTSDHGDALGDHGHIEKWTMYDCVIRVPMILWAPGYISAGTNSAELIEQMDIAATLFELAGIQPPARWEAKSALPVVEKNDPVREYVFAEQGADNVWRSPACMAMVRSETYKLVQYFDQNEGELYDLANDPGEKINLWNERSYQEIIHDLEVAYIHQLQRSCLTPHQR